MADCASPRLLPYLKVVREAFEPIEAHFPGGLYLRSDVEATIPPGQSREIPFGVEISPPLGYSMYVQPLANLTFEPRLVFANEEPLSGVVVHNPGGVAAVLERGANVAVVSFNKLAMFKPYEMMHHRLL